MSQSLSLASSPRSQLVAWVRFAPWNTACINSFRGSRNVSRPPVVGFGSPTLSSCCVRIPLLRTSSRPGTDRDFRYSHRTQSSVDADKLKTADRLESLLQDRHRIAAGDDNAGGKIHRIMETLDGGYGLAVKGEVVAHSHDGVEWSQLNATPLVLRCIKEPLSLMGTWRAQ